ncbi:MAG: hypothetical protein ACR2K0_08065 [Acidimicrobiales bacterium]|jgi:hypothetical protein
MDARQLGEAGLQGWRGRLADRVAPAVARRTSLEAEQVSRAIGGVFIALAVLYLVKATRDVLRR